MKNDTTVQKIREVRARRGIDLLRQAEYILPDDYLFSDVEGDAVAEAQDRIEIARGLLREAKGMINSMRNL
jgi:hypothetical protein